MRKVGSLLTAPAAREMRSRSPGPQGGLAYAHFDRRRVHASGGVSDPRIGVRRREGHDLAGAGFEPPDPAAGSTPPGTPSSPPVRPNLADPAPVRTPALPESPVGEPGSPEIPILPVFAPTAPPGPDPGPVATTGPPQSDRPGPSSPGALAVKRFLGVYLLTLGADGPTAVPGLALELGDVGAALTKADGAPVWACGWDEVCELSTPERAQLPEGGHGVVVVIATIDGRSHRFVVPAYRNRVLSRRPSIRWPGATTCPPKSGSVHDRCSSSSAPWVILAGALAVLLLSAGHIVGP